MMNIRSKLTTVPAFIPIPSFANEFLSESFCPFRRVKFVIWLLLMTAKKSRAKITHLCRHGSNKLVYTHVDVISFSFFFVIPHVFKDEIINLRIMQYLYSITWFMNFTAAEPFNKKSTSWKFVISSLQPSITIPHSQHSQFIWLLFFWQDNFLVRMF